MDVVLLLLFSRCSFVDWIPFDFIYFDEIVDIIQLAEVSVEFVLKLIIFVTFE